MAIKAKIIVPVAALTTGYLSFSSYIAARVIPIARSPVEGLPSDVGLNYEDVEFLSIPDGTILSGWLIPQQTENGVIIINGWKQNRVDETIPTLELARDLHEAGLALLLFDLRGRGTSNGRALLLTHDMKDIAGAVRYMKERGYKSVSLLGFSAGAVSSLVFAGGDKAEELSSIVSDSAFSDTGEALIRGAVKMGYGEAQVRLLAPGIFLMARIIYGTRRIDPISIVGKISCPVFFIHGGADEDIPISCPYELFLKSGNPQDDLWIAPGAEHTQAYKINPDEYIIRVVDFLQRHSTSDQQKNTEVLTIF